jgi:hypothetical protein
MRLSSRSTEFNSVARSFVRAAAIGSTAACTLHPAFFHRLVEPPVGLDTVGCWAFPVARSVISNELTVDLNFFEVDGDFIACRHVNDPLSRLTLPSSID